MQPTGLALAALALLGCTSAAMSHPDAAHDAFDAQPVDADAAPIEAASDAPEPSPPWIRDEGGGVLILRGTNVSGAAKYAPDFLPPYGAADFVRLHDEEGFDAIRLLVFWEAIEPSEGSYDEHYIAAVHGLVTAANAAGLYVIIDMHQDVYGRGFGFDGAPRWSCDASLYASFMPPTTWSLAYFEPQVETCFDRFYAHGNVRDRFTAAWAHLAHALSDANVFAYELLNEPSWGSTTPGQFDRSIAPDFYGSLADALRTMDPAPWIAVEPAPLASAGLATQLLPPARPRILYAPHMYPPTLELGQPYDPGSHVVATILGQLRRDATRLALPMVITEMGVRRNVMGAQQYLRDVFDAYDATMTSVTQWDLTNGDDGTYGLWDPHGAPSWEATSLARPYPRRIAGMPIAWSWNGDAGVFTMDWYEDGSASGETLVTVPSLAFPAGARATIDDGGAMNVTGSVLHVSQRGGARQLILRRM